VLRVSFFGVGFWVLGFGFWVLGFGFCVFQDEILMIKGYGLDVQDLGF